MRAQPRELPGRQKKRRRRGLRDRGRGAAVGAVVALDRRRPGVGRAARLADFSVARSDVGPRNAIAGARERAQSRALVTVGVLRLTLYLHENHSLKGKRSIV